ncbi:hypothetical protein SLEP1_g15265 [Rubroshorea leprosula]|uniref:Uncharacterized protein n=1 Tax=Rubroshorea leprosula TaxID=152421 RepID=A0AAV5ISP1_9ROSI|nr:hypothetical protein SLEP1_g15265 [Rubroshorea leprosula]
MTGRRSASYSWNLDRWTNNPPVKIPGVVTGGSTANHHPHRHGMIPRN